MRRGLFTWASVTLLGLAVFVTACGSPSKENQSPATTGGSTTPPSGSGAPSTPGSSQPPTSQPTPSTPTTQTPNPAPVNSGTPQGANGSTLEEIAPLMGNVAAAKSAMAEKASVQYRVVVVGAVQEPDKTKYLDQLVAQRGGPGQSELTLVLFAKENFDLRFAMGGIFRQKNVSVDELYGLAKQHYFSKARQGDPAAGLADLIHAVNQRVQ